MLIVDSSIAIKWFVIEDLRPQARALLASGQILEAPDLLPVEFANAVWKKVIRGEIESQHGATMIGLLPSFLTRLHPSADLLSEALEIALELNHPIYDGVYLACAIRSDGKMITADTRFADKVRATPYAPFIEHIINIK